MKLRDWLHRLDERLDRIEQQNARHAAVLDEHQRRSIANEESVSLLRSELRPLAVHVAVVGGLAKVVGFVGVLVSIAVGVLKLLGK